MNKRKATPEEQLSLDLSSPPAETSEAPKTPETPKVPEGPRYFERDECQNCGNLFESDSEGCYACRSNEAKIAWQKKNPKKNGGQK